MLCPHYILPGWEKPQVQSRDWSFAFPSVGCRGQKGHREWATCWSCCSHHLQRQPLIFKAEGFKMWLFLCKASLLVTCLYMVSHSKKQLWYQEPWGIITIYMKKRAVSYRATQKSFANRLRKPLWRSSRLPAWESCHNSVTFFSLVSSLTRLIFQTG